jgi:acyl carrier protein
MAGPVPDSINAIRLVAELETRLGRDIDPTIVLDTPAIGDLAKAPAGIN